MKPSPKKQKGFTLIELLVVIAIIGLLSSIILVSVKTARDKSKISRSQVELQEMYKALLRYHIDHDAWPTGFFRDDINDLSEWNSTWSSGYISSIGIDPWGTPYYLDGMPDTECGVGQAALCSAGPNRAFQSFNSPTSKAVGDDICIFFEPEC